MTSAKSKFARQAAGVMASRPDPGRLPAGELVVRSPRLNIVAIEAALVSVQREFPRINASLTARRDPLTDEVVANMVDGYRRVDDYLAKGVDLFRMGKSERLLELNRIVLCGEGGRQRDCSARQLSITEQHFYEADGGGVGALMEWLDLHRHISVWRRAAGVVTRVLSQPQLYLEGNHRTGTLLMGYLLAREGLPPFVLSVDNARYFFEPASLIKKRKKHGLDNLLRLPKMVKRLAGLLEDQADSGYLLRD
ncbi:MAG: hypothetical protein WCH04_13550 [Gammaproteobacteria bacterium]